MAGTLERDSRTVSLMTMASRVTGLVREAAMSRLFGMSAFTDAFFFAFQLPNLFRRLFGEGALSAAFLPEYARLDRDDPASARALAAMVFGRFAVGMTVIAAAGIVLLLAVEGLLDREDAELVQELMAVMLPYMPMVCLVALVGAVLQVRGVFAPTAAAPIILNLGMVAGAFAGARLHGVEGPAAFRSIAWAVLIAGILQVAWSAWALRRAGAWPGGRTEAAAASFRTVLTRFVPTALGLGVLQLNTFVDSLIASWPAVVGPTILGFDYPLEAGAQTTLNYAQRLYEFPLGVFGIAIATAIFPRLAAAKDDEAFGDILRRGIRLTVFIGVGAGTGLMLVAVPLTATTFQGAAFTPDDTERVAAALLAYAPAIWAYSANHVFTRAYYSRGDMRTPLRVSLVMVGMNLALNLALIWTPLRETGLAWSTALCAVVQCVVLARILRIRHGQGVDASVLRSALRSMLCAGVMAAVLWAVDLAVDLGDGWTARAIELAILTTTGGLAFLGCGALLRMPEMKWALGRSA